MLNDFFDDPPARTSLSMLPCPALSTDAKRWQRSSSEWPCEGNMDEESMAYFVTLLKAAGTIASCRVPWDHAGIQKWVISHKSLFVGSSLGYFSVVVVARNSSI